MGLAQLNKLIFNKKSYFCFINFKKIKMKKITLVAVAFVAISFASCKKTHVCSCSNNGSTTYTTTLPSQTSSDAKKSCSSYDSGFTGVCTIQ